MAKTMIKFKKTTKKSENKKPIIKFKKVETVDETVKDIRTKINIFKTDMFLKDYLSENETPSTFMEKQALNTSYLVFVKDSNEDMKISEYLKLVKKNIDVSMLFDISNTSGYKLKAMHVLYDTIQMAKNLLNIIYYLEGKGIDTYKEFDNELVGSREMRFRFQCLLYAANLNTTKIITKKKSMLMKNNVILETVDGDFTNCTEYDESYDVFVEVTRNTYEKIPMKSYRNLMFIKHLKIDIKAEFMEDSDCYEEYSYEYNANDCEEEQGRIPRLLTIINTIDNLADAKTEETVHIGCSGWDFKGRFIVDFGSSKVEMSLNEFYSTYLRYRC